jgi:hypothetical protein
MTAGKRGPSRLAELKVLHFKQKAGTDPGLCVFWRVA